MTKSSGYSRKVFLFWIFAIKVPLPNNYENGKAINLREYQIWKQSKKEKKSHLLAPVYLCLFKGKILVMRRVNVEINKKFDIIIRHMRSISNNLSTSQTDYILFHKYARNGFGGDDHLENYGWIGNRMVKIDYGDESFRKALPHWYVAHDDVLKFSDDYDSL